MGRYYFSLIAITIAMASFAFIEIKQPPLPACATPKKWFIYQGPVFPGTATLSDLLNPFNYIEVTQQQAEDFCAGTAFLCGICATENGTSNRPVIDATLQSQLTTYFNSGGSTVGSLIVEKQESR